MNYDAYMRAPITSRGDSIARAKFHRQVKNENRFNRKMRKCLFLKAGQNLSLLQSEIDYANLIREQKFSRLNQISANVAYDQKEIDYANLDKMYNDEVQNMKEKYEEKAKQFHQQVNFQYQANQSLLNEINKQAEEAETEAKFLAAKEIEFYQNAAEARFREENGNLQKQLKEAQEEIMKLQKLSDEAAIARKKIEDYKYSQNLKKPPQISPRIAELAKQQKKKPAHRSTGFPRPNF
ncbi:hypothetical protein TRFO_27644 [Tritrichomonas foetus]|uniref:Uncharacterized protein n=1 Tax=Tritrichomonas foetus TaxID=1144522 RepID=A0A1J4K095_9EUKA|nr:hypothetical protein TRFO_27644 [Tritrichomonas foetus]|eukprot:OHT04841.1 hypothetical protein TRFO_27644 [Tritrichomonas foetus]